MSILVLLDSIALAGMAWVLIVFWMIATSKGNLKSRKLVAGAWSGIDAQFECRRVKLHNVENKEDTVLLGVDFSTQ